MEALLHKLVSERLKGLKADDFARLYEEDVSDLSDLCVEQHFVTLPVVGATEIYKLQNGLVAMYRCRSSRWSLYESAERVQAREHLSNWANFARGAWVNRIPQNAGIYFVRDLEGRRLLRELVLVNGRLKDVSGGFVVAGKVTEWRGDWWIPALPGLPEST